MPTTELQPENDESEGSGESLIELNKLKTQKRSFAQIAKEDAGMKYTVCDLPPPTITLLLGVQHYLTMLGASVVIPILIVGEMGGSDEDTANVICTIFLVSGLNTLVQTTIGDRLPIVQGGSFAFLAPTFAIIYNDSLQAITDSDERFLATMRLIQGAIIVCALVQIAIGYSGLMTYILRYLSPISMAPTICAVGLGLYDVAFIQVGACAGVGLVQIIVLIIASQYLARFTIPISGFGRLPIFELFPILISIVIVWIYAFVLTEANAWEDSSVCRTDNTTVIQDSQWFRVPYPTQWGAPVFEGWAIAPMLGAMIASMIESIADYYACARLSGAPPPTGALISRGLAAEGIGMFMSGIFGTGNGTTSYSENIGALQLTKVGSRAVVQAGAFVMVILSLFGKFGAIFASMPSPMVGGLYCCLFGVIAAVGLSNLQHTDMNSSRNLFIVGFAIFNSLSIAGPSGYFNKTVAESGNPFGEGDWADIALPFFNSPMIIAFLSAFILDNTVPGTAKERGLDIWDKMKGTTVGSSVEFGRVYGLPSCLAKIFRNCAYLDRIETGEWAERSSVSGEGDLCEIFCCSRKSNDETIM